MKKLIIVLLCLLAVFAVVSCNQDPKKTDQPASEGDSYYRLTATRAAKRFSFKYAGGESGINPEDGDTITFKYRSSHPVTHFYLRNEKASSTPSFANKTSIDPYIEAGEDGWITFSFTYPEMEDTYPVSGFCLELANYTTGSHDEGLGMFAEGDYLDIMDLYFNDELLTIEPEKTINTGNHGVWNNTNTDQTLPTLEVINL